MVKKAAPVLLLILGGCAYYAPTELERAEEERFSITRGVNYVGQAADPNLAPPSYGECFSETFKVTAEANEDDRGFDASAGQYCPGEQIRRRGQAIRTRPLPALDVPYGEPAAPTTLPGVRQ